MSSLTASLITSVQIIRIPVLWYLSDKSGLKLNTNVQTWGLLERHAELSYLEVESTLISCVPSIFKSLFFSCMSENLWNQEILNNWPFNKFWNSMPGAVHAFVSKSVASQTFHYINHADQRSLLIRMTDPIFNFPKKREPE